MSNHDAMSTGNVERAHAIKRYRSCIRSIRRNRAELTRTMSINRKVYLAEQITELAEVARAIKIEYSL